ncbi:MAG: DUF885 domain-containing protein [Phycisphaerales bacterium]
MKKLAVSLLFVFISLIFAQAQNSASQQLYKLFDDQFEFSLHENPLFATSFGDHRFDDKLSQQSIQDINRRNNQTKEFLQRLNKIDSSQLAEKDKLNYDLFKHQLENALAWNNLKSYLMPISQMGGFYTDFAQFSQELPFNTVKDYENYITRLKAYKTYARQHIDLMKIGIQESMVPPKVILEPIPKTIESLLTEDINETELYKPFKNMPSYFTDAQIKKLRADGITAIQQTREVNKQVLEFIKNEYIPAGKDSISVYALPNGKEYYKQCIRDYTTLELSPEDIFEVGQDEVKRIRTEMLKLIENTSYKGDLPAFKKFIQTDKRFRPADAEEMLKQTAFIMKQTDGVLPKFFSLLPRMPVGIKEVPGYLQKTAPLAYYNGPSFDGTRAGYYYINTYDANNRSLYNLAATTLHETNPGHHLQIALAMEINDVPVFRKFASYSAYTEGWALYAEKLGDEMEMYKDEYSQFGKLDNEMWRSCRLVVDTGIHHFGWSRQKAIDYMLENTSLDKANIIVEVDRYIAWPGQALSYKIGELKILELRKKAQKKLKAKFDIREFHNVILQNGSLPLDILQQKVDQWLTSKK